MESVWGFGLLVGRTKQFEDVSLGYGKMQCVCPRAYVIKMSQNPKMTSSHVLICPQPEDIQFVFTEDSRNEGQLENLGT